jgi:inner membrane transporter RhtA
VSAAARAGAPVALVGAAIANLACVPVFVHAYAVASPLSVALLRLVGSAIALMLCVPLIRRVVVLRSGPWWHPAVWAFCVVGMNTTFYLAIDRIPLAIAVAVSFTGPIVVAAWHSRTRRHALGVVCVALGVLALVHPGFSGVDPVGLALALGNASMWALYIVAVRRLAGAWSPLSALVAGTLLGSLLLVPGAAATGGVPFDQGREIALLAVVGAFSAGLPYLIELLVMQRVTMRTFSVLQALYPAAGVAVGVIGLGQGLRPIELGGIVLVTIASALALENSIAASGDGATPSRAASRRAAAGSSPGSGCTTGSARARSGCPPRTRRRTRA